MINTSTRLLARLLFLLAALTALPAFALDKVTLQLNWYHQFQFAGYYAALEQGYYRDAGLDVNIVEAVPGADPVVNVLAGKTEFGVGTSNLLVTKNSGKPVVILGVILQHSPQVMLARKHGSAQNIQDLIGKRVMFDPLAEDLLAYLKKEGVAPDRFSQVVHSYDPQDLIQGKVEAMSGSLLNEAFYLDRARFAYHAFTPRSAGIDFYGDNLFTTEQTVKAQPDQVRAFREASLRGWQYAMSHQAEIADLILAKYSQKHDRDYLLFQAKQMQDLMQAEKVGIGAMSPERWQKIAEAYVSLGMLPKNFNLAGLFYDPTPPPKKDITSYYWIVAGALLLLLIAVVMIISIRLARVSIVLRQEKQRQLALQEQLKTSEERYRGLFNSMDNGFALSEIICGSDGKAVDYRFIEVNPSFEKVSGLSREKLIGKRAKEVLPNMGDEWVENFAEVAVTGQPKQIEKFSQKTCRWFSTNAFSPSPGKFAVVTQEITERKQMEIALSKANEQLNLKFEEISQLQEKLREQAIRDPLTGLYNRRYLDETLMRELSRAKRENYSLCIIMVDIDFFKKVNDTYGHLAGDEVLKKFAVLLRDSARKEDVACRYGGEEFLLMTPRMPLEAAEERSNELREKFAMQSISFGEAQIKCTLSIGIAVYPNHGETPEDLTNCADQALYTAKGDGRNRVIVYSDRIEDR